MMTRRGLVFALAFVALARPASAEDASATAFVTAIYGTYKGKDAKGIAVWNERTIRRYFEPALASAMAKDHKAAAQRQEVGTLDFDPFLDAQDWEVVAFDIAVSEPADGKARATVKFDNLDAVTTVLLDLVRVKKAWRIYDITWLHDGKPETLRSMFLH